MWTRIWALLDRWLFGPAAGSAGLLGQCRRLLRYPYAVVRDLARGEINLRAMSLVYTTLLSLIPLLAFSFAILKAFGGHHDLEPIVYEFFSPVGGAAATELTNRVVQFASHVSSGLVGSVGLALLAWTLVGTIKKVEDSFNFLWHVEQPRGFARRLAEYTSLLIAGPVLLVGFIGLSHAALSSAPLQEMARLPLLHRLRGTGIALAPAHALRGPCARRRLPALECQSTRGRARAAGHRGRADGHIPRARRAPGRHRAGGAPAGARYPQHPRAGDPRHRAPSGERARRPAPAADPRGRPPARRAR